MEYDLPTMFALSSIYVAFIRHAMHYKAQAITRSSIPPPLDPPHRWLQPTEGSKGATGTGKPDACVVSATTTTPPVTQDTSIDSKAIILASSTSDTKDGAELPGEEKSTSPATTADADGAATADTDTDPATSEEMAVYITVHPPPQSGAAPLVLEPLAGVELVMQVRQLLGEIPQTCIYSAFQLVAVTPKEVGEGSDGDGVVGEDVAKGPGDVMNDYAELRSIPAVLSRPGKVEVRCSFMRHTEDR